MRIACAQDDNGVGGGGQRRSFDGTIYITEKGESMDCAVVQMLPSL